MSEELYTFGAASKKQWLFLNSPATIVVYGGSMGGGKTYTGLLKHLKYVDNPHYRGIVVRKSSATIMKSGFLFDEAVGLYKAFDPAVKIGRKYQKFTWPSGAEIVFTHLATDEDAELLKGGQFSFAMCDEATELKEDHVLRLLSRIRSKAGIPPQLALTCNPSPDSFLRRWVDWWLIPKGQEHAGRPDPKKNGLIRWFIRQNNEMVWGETREELIEKYGNPELSEDDDAQIKPISMQFIGASIYDNPPLIKQNPLYLSNLLNLKAVAKERDLWGNWDVREEASGYWKREWCLELDQIPLPHEIEKIARVYDLAATLKSASQPDPDYTVGVKMAKLKTGQFVVLDVIRFRARPGDVTKKILDIAKSDGRRVDIVVPQDPGSAGKTAAQMLVSDIVAGGFYCITMRTSGVGGKVDRFRPFSAAAQNGLVDIVKNCCDDLESKSFNNNEFYYSELEAFDGGRDKHDDCADATADAFCYLASKYTLPSGILEGLKSVDLSNDSPLLTLKN